jgi:hypothetical protein
MYNFIEKIADFYIDNMDTNNIDNEKLQIFIENLYQKFKHEMPEYIGNFSNYKKNNQ